MIYLKLFKLSKLSNHEITKRLGITHTERQRFEQAKKIDLTTIKRFSQLLGVSESDVVELIVGEIREIYRK